MPQSLVIVLDSAGLLLLGAMAGCYIRFVVRNIREDLAPQRERQQY